jgi:hypothetical protein
MDSRAGTFSIVGKGFDILIQTQKDLILDCARLLPQRLPIIHGCNGKFASITDSVSKVAKRTPQLRIT